RIRGLAHPVLHIPIMGGGISAYPAVPGHEVIGRVVAMGPQAKGVEIGQAVGVGWGAASCMHCHQCLSGDQNVSRVSMRSARRMAMSSSIKTSRTKRGC